MSDRPGDQLRRLGMPGILTMSPEQGGITELLCDMDECYRPRGRWDFEPIPNPMPMKIPEWIPTTDHFPKTKEVGGQKVAGNVRLAHRLCNRADYQTRIGNPQEAERARAEKENWHRDHREASAANAERYATAEERWDAMRRATDVSGLEAVTARYNDLDTTHFATDFWLHIWRITAGDDTFAYVGATRPSPMPETILLPFEVAERTLELRPNARGAATIGRQLGAAGLDVARCAVEVTIAIGPIVPLNAKIAAVEEALGGHLCSRGYRVIGERLAPHPFDRGLFGRVCDLIDNEFPARPVRA